MAQVFEFVMSVAVTVITVARWMCVTLGTDTQTHQKVRRHASVAGQIETLKTDGSDSIKVEHEEIHCGDVNWYELGQYGLVISFVISSVEHSSSVTVELQLNELSNRSSIEQYM